MNADQEAGVLSAAKQLKIRDVVLAGCRFERPTQEIPALGTEVRQEHKRGVEYQISDVDNDGVLEKQLQVLVELGVRIAADGSDDEQTPVYVQIEAEFVVVYQVSGVLDEQAISSFANYNAVHNVWPFWRQHVFDVVQRARLPLIEVPLFSGVKS